MVLAKLESLQAEVRRLEEKQAVTTTELAVLKARIAIVVVIATVVASPLVSWVLKKLGL